jgi:hypothetical protein
LRKLITISFLSFYLLGTTEIAQLGKLPALVQHFVEHKGLNQEITIWDFLCMHYGKDINDNDQDRDMKLPFKTPASCSSCSIVSIPRESFSLEKPVYRISITPASYREKFYNAAYLACIWQPPRSC